MKICNAISFKLQNITEYLLCFKQLERYGTYHGCLWVVDGQNKKGVVLFSWNSLTSLRLLLMMHEDAEPSCCCSLHVDQPFVTILIDCSEEAWYSDSSLTHLNSPTLCPFEIGWWAVVHHKVAPLTHPPAWVPTEVFYHWHDAIKYIAQQKRQFLLVDNFLAQGKRTHILCILFSKRRLCQEPAPKVRKTRYTYKTVIQFDF